MKRRGDGFPARTLGYDKYDVNDFALGPLNGLAQPATASASPMLLGNDYRPSTANAFMGRFTYLW